LHYGPKLKKTSDSRSTSPRPPDTIQPAERRNERAAITPNSNEFTASDTGDTPQTGKLEIMETNVTATNSENVTAAITAAAIDVKSGRPLAIVNANRTLGRILRLIGILVNFEPYKNLTIDGSNYHSRFTFTGKNATGGFLDVIDALILRAGFALVTPRATQLPAAHAASTYNAKIPAYYAILDGSGHTAGYRIIVIGSNDPNGGLIPIFHVIDHPKTAAISPKQYDKSTKTAVSFTLDFNALLTAAINAGDDDTGDDDENVFADDDDTGDDTGDTPAVS
jgi:hypothetical protein